MAYLIVLETGMFIAPRWSRRVILRMRGKKNSRGTLDVRINL